MWLYGILITLCYDSGYGLDILVYSGDDDSQCATVGTQDWIWSLGYEVSAVILTRVDSFHFSLFI